MVSSRICGSQRGAHVRDEGQLVVAPHHAGALALLHRIHCLVVLGQATEAQVRVRHTPQQRVLVVARVPQPIHAGHVRALELEGRPAEEQVEQRVHLVARVRVAAHEHRVRAHHRGELVIRHLAPVELLHQPIHVVDGLDVHHLVAVEELVGGVALVDEDELRGVHQPLHRVAPAARARGLGLVRGGHAAHHVHEEPAARLLAVDGLVAQAHAPQAACTARG